MIHSVRKLVSKISKDQLYRNSSYLVLNGAILAILGFVFWVIVARMYSVQEIGLASTMISLMSLFIAISSLGFNISLLKYLPNDKNKLTIIHPIFLISTCAMIILSVAFLVFVHLIIPELSFLKSNLGYIFGFILFMGIAPMFNLLDSVFIAKREAHHVLLKSVIWSLLKICTPFFFLAGAFGIFTGWGLSTLIALIVSLNFIHYMPVKSNWRKIRKMMKFTVGNYFANLSIILTFMGLPIFVTYLLGAEATGYFYIPWMIALAIFMLPQAVGKVLLSESNQSKSKKLLAKALRFTYTLVIPAVVILLLIGKYLLLAFGGAYSSQSYLVLIVLLISSVIYSIHALASMYFNINHKIINVVIINLSLTILTYLLSIYFTAKGLHILGVALAWFIANIITLLFLYPLRK